MILTLQMLRLLLPKAQGCKDFWNPPNPCHIGTHWIALAEYFQMSTNVQGVSVYLSGFLHIFVMAK